MKNKPTGTPEEIEERLNPNLRPLWVDNFFVGMRSDNLVFLRFSANLPEASVEQTQIMTSKEHLKKFVDVLCSSLNYYPIKKLEKK